MTKKLNLTDAIMLVAGSMIGSGIFIVSADMCLQLGSAAWLLTAWLIAGIITVLGALSYGELAAMMPEAGGQYTYIQRAWGKVTAFTYGWTVFAVIQSGVIAAVAVGFANFSSVFFPACSKENILFHVGDFKLSGAQILAIVMVWFLTFLNNRGIKSGKLVQRIFTFAKLAALAGLVLVGLYWLTQSNVFATNLSTGFKAFSYNSTAIPGAWQQIGGLALFGAFGSAMVGSLFSADAWNNVTFISSELENPAKNIPRSLLFGTSVVVIIYLLANIAYIAILPVKGAVFPDIMQQGISHATNSRVGSAAMGVVFGKAGILGMALLIMISTFGCNNGLILAGARLYKTMAEDGLFFKQAATLNKNEVPGNALLIQAIWTSVLCLSGSYSALVNYSMFASILFYIITVSAIFKLRIIEKDTLRPFRVNSIIPILFLLLIGFVAIVLLVYQWENTKWGLLLVAAGIPAYYIINGRTTKPTV